MSAVIDNMLAAGEGEGGKERVTVGEMLFVFGQRAYGPLLLVPALLVVSPLSAIPFFSSTMGLCIALIAAQMVVGRRVPWIPQVILCRPLERRRVEQAAVLPRRIAVAVDRVIRPRFGLLTRGPMARLVALMCMVLALTMPPLEMVPMASSVAGLAISVFALSLTARDGLLALVAVGLSGAVVWLASTFVPVV